MEPPATSQRGPCGRGSSLRVPGFYAGMAAHGVVHRHELSVTGEYRRGNVIDLAADEPAHRHVQFEIDDVECRTAEERVAEDVLFRRPPPRGQKARHHRLA